MPYPIVDAAYGYKPVNLIGGQVFSGSTREYPIAYNYGQNLFYGEPVTLSSGFIIRAYTPGSTSINTSNTITGIFLGCSFTDPVTKQKRFNQYYPANTTAGDIKAIVCDDPDTVFRMAVVPLVGSATIGSMSQIVVGQNAVASYAASVTAAGSTATGNSALGVVAAASNTASAAWRILQLVPDTQINTAVTYVSGSGSSSIVVSGLTVGGTIYLGWDMYELLSNGQLQWIGAVGTATTVSSATSQSLSMTTTTTVTGAAGASLVLVQSQEVLAKLNFGVHRYYVA